MSLTFIAFNRAKFLEAIRRASKAPQDTEDTDQARYLASYLHHPEAGTKSLVIEEPYTDRHYVEEFAGYYSTAFRPPPQTCVRLHAFREEVTEEDFARAIREAQEGRHPETEIRIQNAYLGFVVVRPIPSAPIGRTVLKTYGASRDRNYGPPMAPHRVHLAGLELTVEGVPFQQQDQAVGACATTAIWSSLSKVVRADGGRSPTPLAVTMQANKNLLSGRAFPAVGGLELGQMLGAIRGFGYSPHVLKPGNNPEVFHAAIKTYIASGIPVILQINPTEGDLHAVAVTGFWSDSAAQPIHIVVSKSRTLRVRPMAKLYVHDDRLGPYSRMKILHAPVPVRSGKRKRKKTAQPPDVQVVGWPYEDGFEEFQQTSNIWHAIVPLYPKIRLSAEDLIRVAQEALPLCSTLAGGDKELEAGMYFALSGQYLRDLRAIVHDPKRASKICLEASFPRYLGVIRFMHSNEWFGDILCDTTEIYRERPPWARIIGLIPASPDHLDAFERTRNSYGLDALVA